MPANAPVERVKLACAKFVQALASHASGAWQLHCHQPCTTAPRSRHSWKNGCGILVTRCRQTQE